MSRDDPSPAEGVLPKALTLLDDLSEAGGAARFSELLARGRYPKATLHRLLRTLVEQRMLAYDPVSQRYSLGLRLVRLAHAAWAHSSLAEVARAPLDALAAETGLTLHLAQLDDGQVLYVDKRNARRPLTLFSEQGKIGPAFCTGVGKAMLAFLPEAERAQALSKQSFHRYTPATLDRPALEAELAAIRAEGVAFDREEHEPGVICVAVPVLDATRRPVGAISATSATTLTDLAALAALAPRLREGAAAVARAAEARRAPALPAA